MKLSTLTNQLKALLAVTLIGVFSNLSYAINIPQEKEQWFEDARSGNTDKILEAIRSGENVNKRHKKSKNTALMLAAINDHIDLVQLLLDKGADINLQNKKQKNTALIYAVSKPKINKELIELLIQSGADPAIKNKNNKTSLDIAKDLNNSDNHNKDVIHLLQKSLLNPPAYVPTDQPDASLPPAYTPIDQPDTSLEPPAYDTPDHFPEQNQKLLNAIINNNLLEVEKLLDAGAQVDTPDTNGSTPLMNASLSGNKKLTLLLLNRKADPNVQNSDGATALMLASYTGDKDIVEILLDYNANPHAIDKYERTALAYAKNTNIVNALNNWLKKENETFKVSTQTLSDLLKSNPLSDLNSTLSSYDPTKMNLTLFYAARNGHPKLVEYLLKQTHQKPSIRYAHSFYGDTPLLAAIKENHVKTVELLFHYGANVYTEDKKGDLPLDIAKRNKNDRMIEVINKQIEKEEEIHDPRFE